MTTWLSAECLEFPGSVVKQADVQETYSSDEIKAEVAFDVSSQIHRKASQEGRFINSSSRHPLVLVISSDCFP